MALLLLALTWLAGCTADKESAPTLDAEDSGPIYRLEMHGVPVRKPGAHPLEQSVSIIYGTGFVAEGRLYTAGHLFTDEPVDLNSAIPFTIGSVSPSDNDMVSAPVMEYCGEQFDIAESTVSGEKLTAFGYPQGSVELIAVEGHRTTEGYMTGQVVVGMSGGPVINERGEVVGVISMTYPLLGLSQYVPITKGR
jgi:hypothetical protein